MRYDQFKYLYPPRPEYKTPPHTLEKYDDGQYIAQPKYNGSACLVFTNGDELHVYNRHKKPLAKFSPFIPFRSLAKSNAWYVYAGEYLNKGKRGEMGEIERDKFVIWDLLVWDGEYLIGQTMAERLKLLEKIYPCHRAVVSGNRLEMYEHLCCTEHDGIYKAPTYGAGFDYLYQELAKIDLYEGLVLKKLDAKLSFGFQEKNNNDWQIKCRKETKLYNF
jgi:ATP-dependent DNA ligase